MLRSPVGIHPNHWHLLPDPFQGSHERQTQINRSEFRFWELSRIQSCGQAHSQAQDQFHVQSPEARDLKDHPLVTKLSDLLAQSPLERVWDNAEFENYVRDLHRVSHSSFTVLLELWDIDLCFPHQEAELWQKMMSSSVSEPFRKRTIGFRNPTEALLGLGPDKNLLAEFTWLKLDCRFHELDQLARALWLGLLTQTLTGLINTVRELVWTAYQLFLLSVQHNQLNRPGCDQLARSFIVGIRKQVNIAPEAAVHSKPTSLAGRLFFVPVRTQSAAKSGKKQKDGSEKILGRNREEKPRAQVYDRECRRAQKFFLQKQNDSVMAPVFTSTGVATGRYACLKTMNEFVYSLSPSKWHNDKLVACLQTGRNLVQELKKRVDARFPSHVVDRHKFSFTNGVYFLRQDMFIAHHQQRDGPSPSEASINYFNMRFPESEIQEIHDKYKNRRYWMYFIDTPPVQVIFDKQRLPEVVCFFGYAMFGRMLYRLKDLDNWQLWLYLLGKAGTGKSSLLNIISNIYPPEYVAIISNVVQKNFQTEHLQGKLVYLCPDVSERFKLDQAMWCTMVTGEENGMSLKSKGAIDFMYDLGGGGAGNVLLPYVDQSGNISRRLLIILFEHEMLEVNILLNEELIAYLAEILKKINASYLKLVQDHKKDDIWNVLPMYFVKNRQLTERHTNTLADFMHSNEVKIDPNYVVDVEVLRSRYTAYCKTRQRREAKVEASDASCAFVMNNLGIVWATELSSERPVLLGVTVIEAGEPRTLDPDYVNEPARLASAFRVDEKQNYKEDFSGLGRKTLNYDEFAPKRHRDWKSGLPRVVNSRTVQAEKRQQGLSMAEEFLAGQSEAARTMRLVFCQENNFELNLSLGLEPEPELIPEPEPVPGPGLAARKRQQKQNLSAQLLRQVRTRSQTARAGAAAALAQTVAETVISQNEFMGF